MKIIIHSLIKVRCRKELSQGSFFSNPNYSLFKLKLIIIKSNLFFGCNSASEVQLRFDELSRIFNDQDEMLQALKAEYSTLMAVLSESKPAELVKEETFTMSDIIKCLEERVNPEGLKLEIVGKYLWLSGATFAVKEGLKQLGFRYSPDKKSWYWRTEADKSSNTKPIPLEMIRSEYGTGEVALR